MGGMMNQHASSARFHEILAGLGDLHDQKQADYGTDEDPFHNIPQSANDWGIPPWVAAMIRGTDKVRRLQAFHRKGVLKNESAMDSLRDLAVYAVIALVLMEEEALPPS
ncbi:MAG: hypothetical protein A2Y74_06990 [Actinobacteria bacterium RBG_13_63_9]|nr:MAG: hypothetical protein A2Y74_06990 [Actinobacteria bacterium RBG_13_63_9]